jgi:ketosteroid isomerase-like protein
VSAAISAPAVAMNDVSPGPGRTRDWELEIRTLEAEACRAFLARDLDALRRLWSESYAVNSPLNRVVEREQVLRMVRDGRIAHVSFDHHIESLQRHGDTVIVMGRETIVDDPEKGPVERRYTNIWRREDGAWRAIGRHANIVSAPLG